MDDEVVVPLGEALRIARLACGLAEGSELALEARVRLLHRLGVPRRRREKSNARFAYGLTEIAEIVVAIELMKAFMPPAPAARFVSERWNRWAPMAVAGIGDLLPPGFAERYPARASARCYVAGTALADLGSREVHAQRWEGPLGDVVDAAAEDAIGASGTLIDGAEFMPVVYRLLAGQPLASPDAMLAGLRRLRQSERREASEGVGAAAL